MKLFYTPLSSGMLLFIVFISIIGIRAEPMFICNISLDQGVTGIDEDVDGAGPAAFAGGRILAAAQREKMKGSVSLEINTDLGEQAYRIVRDGQTITVTGGDPRGVMYGGLEVAECIRLGGLDALNGALHKPYLAKRGIKFNILLDSRTPSFADNGDAARLVHKDGSEVFLSTLPVKFENIAQPPAPAVDYYNGPFHIVGAPMEHSIPGMPDLIKEERTIPLNLSELDAVAFKARIDGDFPLGDQTQRLKSMAVRHPGKEARFLAVVELHEDKSMIESVTAQSANELEVKLTDGRTQRSLPSLAAKSAT